MKLLLDPHGDDAALFAAFTCMAEEPLVIIPESTRTVPRAEIEEAMDALECSHTFRLSDYEKQERDIEAVYAPQWRQDGHEDHNAIWSRAREIFGDRVRGYLTYAPRGNRLRDGVLVNPPFPLAVARKLCALSCFESQIEQASTRPWFFQQLDLREWIT